MAGRTVHLEEISGGMLNPSRFQLGVTRQAAIGTFCVSRRLSTWCIFESDLQ